MVFPKFNLNLLRIFAAVYEAGSMTGAANRLNLTQSGVSQHMLQLEEELGVSLFQRVGRNLIPTATAKELYGDLEKSIALLDHRLKRVSNRSSILEGVVRIGMPIEYGKNVIIPILAKLGQVHPYLNFVINMDYSTQLQNLILKGELDFAVADESTPDRKLDYQTVALEQFLLCSTRSYLNPRGKLSYTKDYFERLDYIEYQPNEPILRRWLLHHIKRKNLNIRVRARLMDVQGVAKFICQGFGVGVLPNHVVNSLIKEGHELHVIEGKNRPLINEIQIVQLRNGQLSEVAEFTLKQLRSALK